MELSVNQYAFPCYGHVFSFLEEHQSLFSLLSNLKDVFAKKKNSSAREPNEEVSFVDDQEISLQDNSNFLDEYTHLVMSNLSDYIEGGISRYSLLNNGQTLNRENFQYAIENISQFRQIHKPYFVFSEDSMNVVFDRNNKKCSFQYFTDEPEMVAVSVRENNQIRIKDFDIDEISNIWNFCK